METQYNVSPYELNQAFKRLAWRLNPDKNGNTKPFKPNEQDVLALKNIAGWIDRQRSENVYNNQLFAKLYIHRLREIIRAYKSDILEDINQKELSKLLDYPLEFFYKAFHQDLYNNQLNNLLERIEKGELTVKNDVHNSQLIPVSGDSPQFSTLNSQLFEREYTEEHVKIHLNEMIAEALNRFS